ncbi:hypothetical protein [Methanobrevibacter sp.]|uniref:hypothetical protein n=1 Tax=Methanobrevibacter sp. TaxID=66852 RepID=UPI00388DD406
MVNKQLQREMNDVQRILTSQQAVFNDELAILRGRIRNYLQSHRKDVLWSIFRTIFQLGREYERYMMYESELMTIKEKMKSNEFKKDLKKA